MRRAAGSSRAPLAIVKIGGSHISGPHIKDWLAAIAAQAGAIVIVPGGGPFAEAVRSAQASMGYDDSAAHWMALMAMAQFGRALQNLNSALRLTASRSAIWRALKDGKVPVWSPEPMARAAALPETWALTSDSLAAWLAGELGAHHLLLVKHGRYEGAAVDVRRLVAEGVVDSLFPRYLRESGVRAWLVAPTESARLAEGLRRPVFPEILDSDETTLKSRADTEMTKRQTPRWGWALTGSGHFLKESLALVHELEHVDLFLSKAGAEVLRMYKQDLDLPRSVRIYRDTSASSVTVGQFYYGIYHTLIVAPATSNAVAKFVYGISDDFITNVFAQAGKCRVPAIVFACDTAPELETEAPKGMVKVFPRPIDLENRERLGRFPGATTVDSLAELREAIARRRGEIAA